MPEAGAIPAYLTDRSNEHGAFLRHRARGEWSIEPRGVGDAAPDEATVGLYRGGALVATRSIRISWPDVDPCAATLPPPPHVTVRAG